MKFCVPFGSKSSYTSPHIRWGLGWGPGGVEMRATKLNLMTAAKVKALGPGRHSDGGGLYLVRDGASRSSWMFMWKRDGKRREMGLGREDPAGKVGLSLADARSRADAARRALAAGKDPISARDEKPPEPAVIPTFGEVATDLMASLEGGWRNAKHAAQWAATLKTYGKPLWAMPVDAVTTDDVLKVLQPIWTEKSETASRLRGRIEHVLSAATVKGHRSGQNPAVWRGHLDQLLPRRQKLSRGHHAAMPYEDIPKFMTALAARVGTSARALEFAVLTAARTGEVVGATWAEIDLKEKLWVIPGLRMKAGREHRVPLSPGAVAVLEAVKPLSLTYTGKGGPDAAPVFPADHGGRLSNMAQAMLLRRMGIKATVHGFRSSFRDWAGEETGFPSEVAEAALAHTVGDATERAYRRGDALQKRRLLMGAWAEFCGR